MAINDINRNMGPSTSQSHTSEAIGHAEDMSAVITNISPEDTKFLSRLPREDSPTLEFSWMEDRLEPPAVNAHLEKEDYTAGPAGSLEARSNNNQYFADALYVTEAQRKVTKVYRPEDELVRLVNQKAKKHAMDIEYALINNSSTNKESGNTPAMTGGIPFFLKAETIDVTVPTSGGVITASSKHHLMTGDFVYFSAATMPTGLKAQTIYYVRLDTTDPDTKFTIFNTQKGAVENVASDKVEPTTAGKTVVIVKNNVVDLAGAADFTLDDLNAMMEMCYQRGGNPSHLFVSPAKKRKFSQLVVASTSIQRNMTAGRKLELVADTIMTDYGTLTAESHRMMPDTMAFAMDFDQFSTKWFERTKMFDLPKKGTYDAKRMESWLGLKCAAPRACGALFNIKR